MAQQTAVEWLIQKLESQYIKTSGPYDVKIIIGIEDIEQAKQMESQQIRFAYIDGAGDQYVGKYKGMYEYYNKKYNDENNQ